MKGRRLRRDFANHVTASLRTTDAYPAGAGLGVNGGGSGGGKLPVAGRGGAGGGYKAKLSCR